MCGLSLIAASWGYSWLHCVASLAAEHGLSSCGYWTLALGFSSCDAWALVAPGYLGSSQTRDQSCVPCIGRRTPIHHATREVLYLVIF